MFTLFCILMIVSFYAYGVSCTFTSHMVAEFERYGLAPFRRLTGYLQILGATGLFVGLLVFPPVGIVAAFGLSVQMLLAFCVRLRIKDSVLQTLPSLIYMWINAGLVFGFFSQCS